MKISGLTLAVASAVFSNTFALSASASASAPLELKYFNARGAGETARIILALARQEYKDTRYEITPGTMNAPAFTAAKESGELDANLGRAPLLLVGSEVIGQSKAIERYLAKAFGMMGGTDVQAAQVDCIAEHCRDVKDAAMRKGFSAFTRDKTDEEKAAARKEWFEEDLPTMLKKLEKAVTLCSTDDAYAVGASTTYADVAIFSLLRDCTMQADQEDTIKAACDCPLLLAIADRIASDESVSKWMEERPVTPF